MLAGTLLAWLLGIHFGLGLPGIWLGYMADECLRGLVVLGRWQWRWWTPHARLARRRALARQKLAAQAG